MYEKCGVHDGSSCMQIKCDMILNKAKDGEREREREQDNVTVYERGKEGRWIYLSVYGTLM